MRRTGSLRGLFGRASVGLTVAAVGTLAAGVMVNPAAARQPRLTFGITHDLGQAGGEPSIQDDGHGHIYITTPQGILSSLGGTGVLLSRSLNDGTTFLPATNVGGPVGGEDSDVASDASGSNVWVADLAAAFSNVVHSTDYGTTFPSQSQTGPEDDREWITPLGKTLVLVYHDLATNSPLIYLSTDGGTSWQPGGTQGMIVGPSDAGFLDTKCNTLVSKPVTDRQGNLYILINTSTYAEDAAVGCANVPALDRLYLAVSRDGGHTFTNRLISDLSASGTGHATSGSWGHTFNQLGIDAAGNLYIDASGTLEGTGPLQNYLLVSTNHGLSFSDPIATHASPNAQVFPAIATGQGGEVAVGYYQGLKPQYQASGNNYQFVIDESFNATGPRPTFTQTVLKPLKGTTPHPDGICTDGIFCGTPLSAGGNRNLADFESMTVDPGGHLEVIIPADCDKCNGNTENWFYKQTDGPVLRPGATNGNGTGNETPVKGSLS